MGFWNEDWETKWGSFLSRCHHGVDLDWHRCPDCDEEARSLREEEWEREWYQCDDPEWPTDGNKGDSDEA